MKIIKGKYSIILLTLTLLCGLFLFTWVGAENVCPYHEVHTPECGYVEAVEGHECNHEHNEECYSTTLICHKEEHTHSETCYDENGTLVCELEEHTHNTECYELDCQHVHDETCGYQEVILGQECTHRCSYCDKTLVREGKIEIEEKDNKTLISFSTTLSGKQVEDELYFYVKIDKDLIKDSNLAYDSMKNCYYVNAIINGTSKTISLENVDNLVDTSNAYLRYQTDYNTTLLFDILLNDVYSRSFNVEILSSSSYCIDEYIKISSQSSENHSEDNSNNLEGNIQSNDSSIMTMNLEDDTSEDNDESISQTHSLDMTTWGNNYVSLTINNGNTVTPNTSVPIKLKFTVPNDVELKDGDVLTYQIDSELAKTFDLKTLINSGNNEFNIVSNGKVIAVAKVDIDGKITVEIKDSTSLKSNVTGYVIFSANVKKSEVPGDGSSVIYDDGTVVTYEDSVKIQKSESNFDPISGIITYTVKIESDGYINGPIDFVDTLSPQTSYINESITISDVSLAINNIEYNNNNNTLSFTINQEKVPAGTYYVSYKVKVKEDSLVNNQVEEIKNDIKMTYNASYSKESSYSKWLKKVDLNKYGNKSNNFSDDKIINWVIDINQGLDSSKPYQTTTSVAGRTITDTLDGNQKYNFPLQLISYDQDGNAKSTEIDIDDDNLELYDVDGKITNNVDDAVKFIYTFPDDATGYYQLKYTTVVNDDAISSTSVTNTVSDNKNNSQNSNVSIDTSESGTNSDIHLSKEVLSHVINSDNETGTATWKVQFTIPENISPSEDYIVTDTLSSNIYKNDGTGSISAIQKVDLNSIEIYVGDERLTGYQIQEVLKQEYDNFDYKFIINFGTILCQYSPETVVTIQYTSIYSLFSRNDVWDTYYYNDVTIGSQSKRAEIKNDKKEEYVLKPSNSVSYDSNTNEILWTIYVNATDIPGGYSQSNLVKNTFIYLEDTWDPLKMEFVEGSLSYSAAKNTYYYEINGNFSSNKESNYYYEYYNGMLSIYFNLEGSSSDDIGYVYRIQYKTKIVDDAFFLSQGDYGFFDNTVKFNDEQHTASTSLPQNEFVSKKGNQLTGENDSKKPIVQYSVYMNPHAINPDGIEYFTAIDTLPEGTSIILDSVKLYEATYLNGVYSKTDQPISNITLSVSTKDNGQQEITLSNIPTGKCLVLEYQVSVNSDPDKTGKKISLKNSVKISGIGNEKGTENNVEYEFSSMSADIVGNATSFIIQKASESSALGGLEGAKFDLYKYNNDGTFIYDETQVSDSNGKMTFGINDNKDNISYNWIYYLVEKDAPSGYKIDATKYAFVILNDFQNISDISGLEQNNGKYYVLIDGEKVEVKFYDTTTCKIDPMFVVYDAVDFTLPETGGTPLVPMTILGITMMSLGIVYFKKKKHTHRKVGEFR